MRRMSGARAFTVPSVTPPAGGTWKLLVADNYRQGTGHPDRVDGDAAAGL
ncbi:hypothetical protein AB0M43_05095 [Longispora sp. NPDC051575]